MLLSANLNEVLSLLSESPLICSIKQYSFVTNIVNANELPKMPNPAIETRWA